MRRKDISAVYPKDPFSVESLIQTMEQLLVEDKYQVVNFDLKFSSGRAWQDHKVTIAQLCMRHDVLIYHYHVGIRPCERFTRFINSTDNSFTMVDDTNDIKALHVSGLTCKKLDNIGDHYKDEKKKNKNVGHSAWDQSLDEEHITYAAMDVYTSYKMYTRLVDMRKCLRSSPYEGSGHREVAGASQEVDD
ncbi:hypothetical protein D1007_45551 [Hordeum vulgare]|nr:hypothetical protein D1007_45551 [Hordeum vulgare]